MVHKRTATKTEVKKAREMLLKSGAKPTRTGVKNILHSFGLKLGKRGKSRKYVTRKHRR